MIAPLKLGTAVWVEGAAERRAVVAPLPSDPTRVVDLNRMEQVRLRKLSEGHAEELAEALVPASLRQVLEGGARALQRVRQALAYAEKWHQRGDLPANLAMPEISIRMLACLPRPAVLRRADGTHLDRLEVKGPGASIEVVPQPTLAAIGWHGSKGAAGWCLALEDASSAVLGRWMVFEFPLGSALGLSCGTHHRNVPTDAWVGLDLPAPRAAEAVLLPAPKLRGIPGLVPGADFTVSATFDTLRLRMGPEAPHLTVQ